jgi:hypothetical protein
MTEAELIEAITSYMSMGQGSVTTLLTLLSAYLIVAYLAGEKLTRPQIVVVNVIYTLVMIGSSAGAYGSFSRAAHYAAELKAIQPDDVIFLSQFNAVSSLILYISCLCASLWFMWNVRRRKTE